MHKGIMLAAALCVTLLVLLAGCEGASVLYGNRSTSEAGFEIDYTILDHEEAAELTLEAGESLRVALAHDRGSVDVSVRQKSGESIYLGSDLVNAEFTLIITESGDYRVSVTGHRAVGKASFLRTAAEKAAPEP